jgi:malonate transporter
MLIAFQALLPVLLIMATGRITAWSGLIAQEHWRGIESLVYYILFPAILISSLGQTDFASLPSFELGAALFLTVCSMAVICLLLRKPMQHFAGMDGPDFTCIMQGSTRWNTYVALAIAANLLGDEGLALMAIAIIAMIPLLNVLNVWVLASYASHTKLSSSVIFKEILKNPFIIGCAIGILVNVSGLPVPALAYDTLDLLGRAALAVGLLAVGAGLDLKGLRKPGPRLGIATVLRLIGMPVLAYMWCGLFGVTDIGLTTAVLACAVPTASASYILARKMGGNANLMAEIITLQTVLAMITLPIALTILS